MTDISPIFKAHASSIPHHDGPCPKVLLERKREQECAFYRLAAQEVRNWRADVWYADEARKNATSPIAWFNALADGLTNRIELKLAERHKRIISIHLPEHLANDIVCPQMSQKDRVLAAKTAIIPAPSLPSCCGR